MPSPPTRRLAFGLDLGPSGTYSCVLHLAPLSAEAFGCVIGASFGAGLPLPLTPGLSLLSFCRLALGLCVLVFLLALCLSAICIIGISVDKLCGSLYESEKCVRARRATSLRFYPMARVGFRETCVRMPHGSTYPSPSSCALQVLWPPR